MSRQQRPVIHPKLRGKLENWQRSQAALAAAAAENQQESASNDGAATAVGETGDLKSTGEYI